MRITHRAEAKTCRQSAFGGVLVLYFQGVIHRLVHHPPVTLRESVEGKLLVNGPRNLEVVAVRQM